MEVKLFLVSFLVGLVDSIPGVSGGTIAFIGGIYDRLLSVINAVSRTRSLNDVRQYDWSFIFVFVPMVLLGVWVMFSLISILLSVYAALVYSVFAIILLFCIVYIFIAEKLRYGHSLIMLISAIPFYYITQLSFGLGEVGWLLRVLVGALSGVAMLLPGISGSFVLLLLGQYEFVSFAVKSFDVLYVLPFALGFLCGVMLCSEIVSRLLRWNRALVVSVLLGVMLGTIPVLA